MAGCTTVLNIVPTAALVEGGVETFQIKYSAADMQAFRFSIP